MNMLIPDRASEILLVLLFAVEEKPSQTQLHLAGQSAVSVIHTG